MLNRLIRSPILGSVLIFVSTLVIYAPAISGELIWDDDYLVGQNPFFRSPIFVFEVFRHYLFVNSPSEYYRPVQNWSYMLDYLVWRGAPAGYHLTNILLHLTNGVLLHRLLLKILPNIISSKCVVSDRFIQLTALSVAFCWVIHPAHNAAVAYISGRADSLASVFAQSAWLLWLAALRTDDTWRRIRLTSAGVLMLLALCSKEIALLWLLLFSIYLLAYEQDRSRRCKLLTIGVIVGLLAIYATLRSLPGPITAEAVPLWPLGERLLLSLRALGDYSSLMLFPDRLLMDRTLSFPGPVSFCGRALGLVRSNTLVVGGATALSGLLVLCFFPCAGRRLRIFGAAWFIICFLPISNLFPLNAEVAEHWIYLASVGFLLFVGGCVTALPLSLQRTLPVLLSLAFCSFSVRTAVRAADWVDRVTFYRRTIEAGGGTPRMHVNLAVAYGDRGDFVCQERILRKTLERCPLFLTAQLSLGRCLMNQGKIHEAERVLLRSKIAFERAEHKFTNTWSASLNLARIRQEANEPEAALEILVKARERFPRVWSLVEAEAALLERTRGAAFALPLVEHYTRRHWWHMGSHALLGRLLVAEEKFDAAIAVMRHASRLDIHDPTPLAAIARIEFARDRRTAALVAQQSAVRRDSSRPSQYQALALILSSLGRMDEATNALDRARELRASVVRP